MQQKPNSEEQLLELLALRSSGIPSRQLLRLFSDNEATQPELPLDLPTGIECYRDIIERALPSAKEEFAHCLQSDTYLLPYFSPDYPEQLRVLGGAQPPLLYVRGNLPLLHSAPTHATLAIIGTRHPSYEGLTTAYRIAREEAKQGAIILSGLAYGCDAAAHRGALDAGGHTIAVVATGLDRTHPEEHQALQEEIIASGGLVLSEYPLGTPVDKYRLIARDRLQAALSSAVLVIECGLKSGTMHTVHFAERYHRPIYALPPHSKGLPSQEGNRLLLRTGRAKPWIDHPQHTTI
ncbi:DNA-processing protein DprA [Porphyromonas sp.]